MELEWRGRLRALHDPGEGKGGKESILVYSLDGGEVKATESNGGAVGSLLTDSSVGRGVGGGNPHTCILLM